MVSFNDIFREVRAIRLDCGLSIVDDGSFYSVVDTCDLDTWTKEYGDATPDNADGYTAFCGAVDCIATTASMSAKDLIAAVQAAEGREAAEEVALELGHELEADSCRCPGCLDGVATILDSDGEILTEGLPTSRASDFARKLAREMASQTQETIELHDYDGVWQVSPSGCFAPK